MDPLEEATIVTTVKDLEKRIEELEHQVKRNIELDARRSSIEVGTPAKGGCLKVYFDPFAPSTVNDAAITEAKRVLELAGGKVGGA